MKKHQTVAVALFGFMACMVAANALAAEAKKPFDGVSLKGWKAVDANAKNTWIVGRVAMDSEDEKAFVVKPLLKKDKQYVPGELINFVEGDWTAEPRGGVDFYTEETYGDCIVDLEFMVSKNSNSGIYLMGEYEVQVLDSWGREKLGPGDVGALYNAAPPKVNGSLPPGRWQRILIDFTAPKFDENGKKIANAKFNKIVLNGKVVQENVEMTQQTPGGVSGKEAPKGPLMFQGNHGPVAFRNIQVFEK